MIKTKEDLRFYIESDLGRYSNFLTYKKKQVELWIRGSESLPVYNFIYSLRHYEYYLNKGEKLSFIEKIKKHYWRFTYRHNELKYNIFIGTNTCGPGLRIVHPGFRRLHTVATIGNNCTILPMVLIGKKRPGVKGKAIIGNNVYISTGVTILAPVTIGDNVIIGAGSVVTKDIPNNCIVGGIPAKLLK